MPEPTNLDLLRQARTASGPELEILLYSQVQEVLDTLLDNPGLREPHLLLLLSRRDLPRKTVTSIAKRVEWMRSYAMKAAVLKHPQTPRHLALPLIKFLFLFDLMEIARTAGVPPDLRRLAEDAILAQPQGIALGQRLTLARRGSHRIAAGMLLDTERRVVEAALENPAMTDAALALALSMEKAHPVLAAAVAESNKWMRRRSVKLGLLRSKHLSLARFAALLPDLTTSELADLRQDPRLSTNLRNYVDKLINSKQKGRALPQSR
ncbi:MAG: hypothetical protein EXQ56_03415 [Acidobacteria bacterium]|nr:hypothetical protein [Acidobacteriota bacterium]